MEDDSDGSDDDSNIIHWKSLSLFQMLSKTTSLRQL